MKVAIIGTGIAGMTAAYYLKDCADITVFEKEQRLGGHTSTVDVSVDGRQYAVDTGFIVYNERTYPNFIRLLDELGVPVKATTMGFSVSSRLDGLEYSGENIASLFAQKKNLFNWQHWRMIKDILRFNKEAPMHLKQKLVNEDMCLGDYLEKYQYSDAFKNHYLVPMGAAIWSSSTEVMMQFPMRFFIQFFSNHGLLQVKDRPQWYVIEGGSRNYIPELTMSYKQSLRLDAEVVSVKRNGDVVSLRCRDGYQEDFDQVVFACHSDQALAMLEDANDVESSVLSAMPYKDNDVVLHTDETMLPQIKSTWSSWNYLLHDYQQDCATLTYNMNILQGIQAPVTFCVTLNDSSEIDPDKIIARFNYAHPVFTRESVAAQQRWSEINGVNASWFCGAYWRNGFHEDGVVSGLKVANAIRQRLGANPVEVLNYEC